MNAPADPAKVRLVQLSDVHFGSVDLPAAEAAADFTRAWAPDLVVFTGDVTLNGLPREFEAGKAWLDGLPRPLLHTPGNHDTPYWNLVLRALTPFARYRRWIGEPQDGGCDLPGLRVRMINTSRGAQPRPDWSKGAINLDLCEAAARDLAAQDPGALRVVGCHHPLVEMPGAPVSGGVHRGETAARVLAEGGVDLILTGHVHVPFTAAIAHPDGHTYAVGAGTLSTRVRGTPPGFNLVEADARTITVTAQGWTGSEYEPWRVWTLERRPRPAAAPD